MPFAPSTFLRRVFLLDAVATGATGILLVAGTGLLHSLLNLPSILMTYAGVFCIAWAALVGFLGTRTQLSSGAVWMAVTGNAAWALGSLALLVSGYVAPTLLGYAFVIAQTVVVGVFAELQYLGMRKQMSLA